MHSNQQNLNDCLLFPRNWINTYLLTNKQSKLTNDTNRLSSRLSQLFLKQDMSITRHEPENTQSSAYWTTVCSVELAQRSRIWMVASNCFDGVNFNKLSTLYVTLLDRSVFFHLIPCIIYLPRFMCYIVKKIINVLDITFLASITVDL